MATAPEKFFRGRGKLVAMNTHLKIPRMSILTAL